MNNEVRCEARTNREQCRSSAPDDLRERHRKDETRRTVDLVHSTDEPSWIDLAEIRVNTTESRFAACLNQLLQQNLPKADHSAPEWQAAMEALMLAATRGGDDVAHWRAASAIPQRSARVQS
jgi:hypothetical protein